MSEKMLVIIAGPSASGKTTAAEHIVTKYGAYRARYSALLARIADEKGLEKTKESLQALSTKLRTERGEEYLTTLMQDELSGVRENMIVIEGNRRMVDLEFAQRFAIETNRWCVFIYVDADSGVRRVRMNLRLMKEGRDTVTEAEFDELERDECEAELPLVRAEMRRYGAIIDNTSCTLEDLRSALDHVIEATKEKTVLQ